MRIIEPSCPQGYTADDITTMLGDDEPRFWHWMRGQTMSLCDGTTYDHGLKTYLSTSCSSMLPGMPVKKEEIGTLGGHGIVAYTWDFRRFCLGLPVID